MPDQDDEDLSWLDERLRASAVEMLEILFASSRVGLITFDAQGVIVGVNPHTVAFDGRTESRYRGVNLLTNLLVRRIGWSDPIHRVLAGETVELTDTRWVTLFSGEERYVDVIAGPVLDGTKVIGGIAYLIDSTERHRAANADLANRRRARELETFLARDVAQLMSALETWSRGQVPSSDATATAIATVAELSTLLDDLLHFIQLGTYQPTVERVLLADVVGGVSQLFVGMLMTDDVAVMADRRLLRAVIRNLARFSQRHNGGPWELARQDGRVVIAIPVERSAAWLQEMLRVTPASAAEAESAPDSLAAARWMTEALHGSLIASGDGDSLILNLPAADPQLAAASDQPM